MEMDKNYFFGCLGRYWSFLYLMHHSSWFQKHRVVQMQMVDLFSPPSYSCSYSSPVWSQEKPRGAEINLFSRAGVVKHFDTVCVSVKTGGGKNQGDSSSTPKLQSILKNLPAFHSTYSPKKEVKTTINTSLRFSGRYFATQHPCDICSLFSIAAWLIWHVHIHKWGLQRRRGARGAIIGTLIHPTAQTGHQQLLQPTEQGQPARAFPGILQQSAHTDEGFTVALKKKSIHLFIYLLEALAEEPSQEPKYLKARLDTWTIHTLFWGNFLGFYSPTSALSLFFNPCQECGVAASSGWQR